MNLAVRIALAVVIVVLDVVTFMVPLGAIIIAAVIIARPRWALELIVKLYADKDWGEPAQGAAGESRPEPPARE